MQNADKNILGHEDLTSWIRSLIKYNNVKAFYNSAVWQQKREKILEEQHHECQIHKSNGEYAEAVTVHHKKFLRQHPELALEDSNLMAVCEECHYNIHHRAETKPQLNEERW